MHGKLGRHNGRDAPPHANTHAYTHTQTHTDTHTHIHTVRQPVFKSDQKGTIIIFSYKTKQVSDELLVSFARSVWCKYRPRKLGKQKDKKKMPTQIIQTNT